MLKTNKKGFLGKLKISHTDLDSVKSYIKDRQTAILVIMFTDIVGFTKITEKYGEKYAGTLRLYHDDILTKAIEENGVGKVIKYIGDSVMAVFSEPTKAVEVSLKIQEKLKHFNSEMPDMEDINIRIGLHMGQVAIENNIQADIFGRHVNRASRIEGLAGRGQVYLSFPVFDSAKGWLQDIEYLGWKYHGDYFLKGIEKPAEIYEVFNKLDSKPKSPIKGKKKRVIPSFVFIISFLLLGGLISWGILSYQKKEVYLFDFKYDDVRLLNGEKLFIDGEPGDHKRLVLSKLENGSNIFYYNVSSTLRYYTQVNITRGENLIKTNFKGASLPVFEFFTFSDDGDNVTKSFEKSYSYYSLDGTAKTDVANVIFNIQKSYSDNIVDYKINWTIKINDIIVEEGSDNLTHDINDSDYYRGEWKVINDQGVFNFEYRPITSRDKLQVNINGSWKW